MAPKPSIFVSHASEDAAIAGAIKDFLEGLFLDADVFVSSRDLSGGRIWMKTLHERLVAARAIVAVVTPLSRDNRWVHFEAGVGFVDEKSIPLCVDGLRPELLEAPFSLLHGRTADASGLAGLADDIASLLAVRKPPTYAGIDKALEEVDAELKRRKVIEPAPDPGDQLDPELLAIYEPIAQRYGDALVREILAQASEKDIPSRSELEAMEFHDLETIARVNDVQYPSGAAFAVRKAMLGFPQRKSPAWEKADMRRGLERSEKALDEWEMRAARSTVLRHLKPWVGKDISVEEEAVDAVGTRTWRGQSNLRKLQTIEDDGLVIDRGQGAEPLRAAWTRVELQPDVEGKPPLVRIRH
jgi:hypothetical protein